jgi:hypothetical protein
MYKQKWQSLTSFLYSVRDRTLFMVQDELATNHKNFPPFKTSCNKGEQLY